MAQLIVRNLGEDVRDRLRERARAHNRSMEAEIREILQAAVATGRGEPTGIGTRISDLFTEHGVENGEIEEVRGGEARPVDFEE